MADGSAVLAVFSNGSCVALVTAAEVVAPIAAGNRRFRFRYIFMVLAEPKLIRIVQMGNGAK